MAGNAPVLCPHVSAGDLIKVLLKPSSLPQMVGVAGFVTEPTALRARTGVVSFPMSCRQVSLVKLSSLLSTTHQSPQLILFSQLNALKFTLGFGASGPWDRRS